MLKNGVYPYNNLALTSLLVTALRKQKKKTKTDVAQAKVFIYCRCFEMMASYVFRTVYTLFYIDPVNNFYGFFFSR